MKSKMDILSLVWKYNIRENINNRVLSFREDKYVFTYDNHSTGRHIKIQIIAPDGDTMLVYDKTEWYSSAYYFNGFGKGYVDGPWVKEIEDIFSKLKQELIVKINRLRKEKKEKKQADKLKEKAIYDKFVALCSNC